MSVTVSISANAQESRSQSDEYAAARALFMEARRLASAGDYAAACPKFEESQRLQPGLGTLYNLADCLERTGRTASAWARFLDAAALANRTEQFDRERVARERASALENQLPRLTIRVTEPEGLEVKRDGSSVGAAFWDTATPLDPGEHVIEATSPGKKPWRTLIVAKASEQTEVIVPPLESITTEPAPSPKPAATAPAQEPAAKPARVVRERPSTSSRQKTLGFAVAGAGVVGLGISTWFALEFKATNDAAKTKCEPDAICENEAERKQHGDLVQEASAWRDRMLVGFAVAGSAVAAGVVIVLTAPTKDSGRTLAVKTSLDQVSLVGSW